MPSGRPLNPAFAAAHGISKKTNNNDDITVVGGGMGKRLELLLKEARISGKLQAANAGLRYPLPEEIFDLRSGIQVDLSMDSKKASETHFVHTEETLTRVNLSDNDLDGSSLDERILRYEQIQSLLFKRCKLSNVNISLSSLANLLVLDLSGNKLDSFHLNCLPENLKELNLSDNVLQNLSATDIRLEALISIDLSNNKFTNLDGLKGVYWPELQSFHSHHNPVKMLPNEILDSTRSTLSTLDVSHCQLQGDRPIDLSDFAALNTVLVSFNRLSVIPIIPASVERFDLTTNRIESIAGMLSESVTMSSLKELLLQDNYLVELDAAIIEKCGELMRLDLSSNKLKTLPYQLGFLANLEHLSLMGNPLHSFKSSEIESTRAIMEKLRNRAPKRESDCASESVLSSSDTLVNINGRRSLDLSGLRLDLNDINTDLKENMMLAFQITGSLNLERNDLVHIPHELFLQLPNVTEISLSSNKLNAFPKSVASSCPKLKRLSLSQNAISDIDVFIDQISTITWAANLTHLDLSANHILSFPGHAVKALPRLKVLNLSFNKICSVEDWDCFSKDLSQLDLSENSLESVDDLILSLGASCPKLEILRIEHNHIRRIPLTLGLLRVRCPHLKALTVQGNPQHAIRPEILEKSTCEQLEYFMNRMTPEEVAIAEAKIDEKKSDVGVGCVSSVDAIATRATKVYTNKQSTDQRTGVPVHADVAVGTQTNGEEDDEESMSQKQLAAYKAAIEKLERELDDPSLTQAKRYALKKALAMERSKLIREERKLGLRK